MTDQNNDLMEIVLSAMRDFGKADDESCSRFVLGIGGQEADYPTGLADSVRKRFPGLTVVFPCGIAKEQCLLLKRGQWKSPDPQPFVWVASDTKGEALNG